METPPGARWQSKFRRGALDKLLLNKGIGNILPAATRFSLSDRGLGWPVPAHGCSCRSTPIPVNPAILDGILALVSELSGFIGVQFGAFLGSFWVRFWPLFQDIR